MKQPILTEAQKATIPDGAPARALPSRPAVDPAYALLSAERETVRVAFEQTRLSTLVAANLAVARAWIFNDNAATLLALCDADRALVAETVADPEAARLYNRFLDLDCQLKSHRAALGVN